MADNLLDKASILLTPTAYNDGSMLSVKPENGDGDFTFSRGSAATRVNAQGLVENVQIISPELVSNGDFSQEGSELVTNGDFSVDSNWIKDSGWSIANGKASCDGTNIVYLTQTGILNTGTSYKVQFDIVDYTSGSVKYRDNGLVSGQSFSNVGSYTDYVTAGGGQFRLMSENFIGSIDNVSVKEVAQNWELDTGWSIGDDKVEADGTSAFLIQSNFQSVASVKSYKIQYEVLSTNGVNIRFGGGSSMFGTPTLDTTTIGVKTIYLQSNGTVRNLQFQNNLGFIGSITNISVKEITDDTDLPRIDYTDGCGSWLLEGQSTNLITYSSDYTQSFWNKSGSPTITANYGSSPDGQNNSTRIQGNSSTVVYATGTYATSNFDRSIYIKATSGSGDIQLLSHNSNTNNVFTINENWQRLDINSLTSGVGDNVFYAVDMRGASTSIYDVEIWHSQAEEIPYATSVIPTNGSIATRLADVATNSGNASLINSTEGVLYAEISALADDGTNRIISLSENGNIGNRVNIFYTSGSNKIKFVVSVNNSNVFDDTITLSDIVAYNKVALKYKANDFAIWINGIKETEQLSGSTYSENTLDKLNFDQGSGSFPFYGKTKALAVYKEALTDAELQSLTTI